MHLNATSLENYDETNEIPSAALFEQLKAENRKLLDMVIEKELELDALHQRLNLSVGGIELHSVSAS